MTQRKPPAGGRLQMSSLFIFLLVGMFALFSLLCVVVGISVYRGLVNTASANEQVRTTLSYIANKVHAADAEGAIEVEAWHGVQALLLREEIDGEPYETRIYFLPGEGEEPGGLYEHFAFSGDDWGLEGGEFILELEDLRIEQEADKVLLTLQPLESEPLTMRLKPWVGLQESR